MAKFYGSIGYYINKETEPGIWEEEIVEKKAYGDMTRILSKYQQNNGINDNLILNNNISIIADPYAKQNFQHIRYLTYQETKWKVNSVEVKYPRLILTLGGVYNEY